MRSFDAISTNKNASSFGTADGVKLQVLVTKQLIEIARAVAKVRQATALNNC